MWWDDVRKGYQLPCTRDNEEKPFQTWLGEDEIWVILIWKVKLNIL